MNDAAERRRKALLKALRDAWDEAELRDHITDRVMQTRIKGASRHPIFHLLEALDVPVPHEL